MRSATTDRSAQRDLQFANVGTPPDGPTVDQATLTRLAHGRAAAGAEQTATPPTLDASMRAGLTPRPGQTRSTGATGERQRTGGTSPANRTSDRKGPAR
ncbi:hypothetical protein [Kribbella sp. NPDC004875]|uniref:hypothetical protein n=1 Tax=Kribbella sp. NPDC004875 TaxID=3364107 RepID=UPI003682745D